MLGDGMMWWRLNGSGNRGRPVGGSEWQCYHGEKHEEMRLRTFHVGIRRISTGEIFLAANNFGDEKNYEQNLSSAPAGVLEPSPTEPP